jgi:hypothetical protein
VAEVIDLVLERSFLYRHGCAAPRESEPGSRPARALTVAGQANPDEEVRQPIAEGAFTGLD